MVGLIYVKYVYVLRAPSSHDVGKKKIASVISGSNSSTLGRAVTVNGKVGLYFPHTKRNLNPDLRIAWKTTCDYYGQHSAWFEKII